MQLDGNVITRIEFGDSQRTRVQDEVIAAVEANPQVFIDAYKASELSHGGRYICADYFKELFHQFNESKETRNYYNTPVHNSAAVLSSILFSQMLQQNDCPEKNRVVMITGVPGAGKTSFVMHGEKLEDDVNIVYEGQLAKSNTSIPKIQEALDAGYHVHIIAVHANPENALENTVKRFDEYGRGASINLMASIQGQLPTGLKDVYDKFGDNVRLTVIDKRDINNPKIYEGWNSLFILQSEGDHESIKQRLSAKLGELEARGTLSEAGRRQALGMPPQLTERVDAKCSQGDHTNGAQRGVQEGDSQENQMKSTSKLRI